MGTNNPSHSQGFSSLDQEITTPEERITSTRNNVSRGSPHIEALNSHIPVPTNNQLGLNSDQIASTSDPLVCRIWPEANRPDIDLNIPPSPDPETDSNRPDIDSNSSPPWDPETDSNRPDIDLNSSPPWDPETDSNRPDIALNISPPDPETDSNRPDMDSNSSAPRDPKIDSSQASSLSPHYGASQQHRPGIGPHNVFPAASNSSQLVATATELLRQAMAYTSNPMMRQTRPEANQPGLDSNSVTQRDPRTNSVMGLHGQASSLLPHFISNTPNPYYGSSQQHNVSSATSNPSLVAGMPERLKQAITSNWDESRRCKCQKSSCIKRYCVCFSTGMYCGESCECKHCFNIKRFEDTVELARERILAEDPFAFAPKAIRSITSSITENGISSTMVLERLRSGCSCKRSMCIKKYCVCFKAKVGCSSGCKCEGCQNSYGINYTG